MVGHIGSLVGIDSAAVGVVAVAGKVDDRVLGVRPKEVFAAVAADKAAAVEELELLPLARFQSQALDCLVQLDFQSLHFPLKPAGLQE